MKRAFAVIVLVVFAVAMLLPLSLNTPTVQAQGSYSIESVDHQIEVMYSGQLIIRDTIHISGQLTGDFLIGFPYMYGAAVIKGLTYDEDNNVFPVSFGVEVADHPGFYFAKVTFQEAAPQVFTIAFILSNSLLGQGFAGTVYDLDFPAYPSLTQEVATCNVEIVFPATPPVISVTKDDGEIDANAYSKSNLPAFTYSPASVTFSMPGGLVQIIDIATLTRQITISPTGDIIASDSYHITNISPTSIGAIKIGLPYDASNVVARDEFGSILSTSALSRSGNTRFINVTLSSSMSSNAAITLTAEYTLPSIPATEPFTLDMPLFPEFDYYVDTATLKFIPPEGADFLSPKISDISFSTSINREAFQETLSISKEGVSKVDSEVITENIQIAYNYSPLWLSFRPTVWMWTIAVIGCVVVAVWKRPKTTAPVRIATTEASMRLSPEDVRAFTIAYDDKSRLTSELQALDARAQKGKIPRRRYKVQKRNLETRLDNISKSINELKKTFRSAGGNYANLIRQLDVAEAELVEVEANTRDNEVRHRKGALPLDAYKKAEADNQQRKEKAETAINGILLRLREEIR